MKNPYRSLLERPLRFTILFTVIVLFFVKLAPEYEAVYDRTLNAQQATILACVGIVMALSCLLDVATAYYVTAGWSALVDRPWVVLLTPLLNLLGAVGSAIVYGPAALVAEALQQMWWTLLGPLVVLGVVLLAQLVAAFALYFRLRRI